MSNAIELNPLVGFDDIRFGMLEPHVVSLLGEPSTRSTDEAGDVVLEFASPQLECGFSSDDGGRLTSLTVLDSCFQLHGTGVVGMTSDALIALGETCPTPFVVAFEEFPALDARSCDVDALSMLFWLSEDAVTAVSLFPAHDEQRDTWRWPSATAE